MRNASGRSESPGAPLPRLLTMAMISDALTATVDACRALIESHFPGESRGAAAVLLAGVGRLAAQQVSATL